MRGYTTREVAEVLDVPVSRILDWTRRGLLSPARGKGRSYVFSFQDIVLLRTARELMDAQVPTRRVREALETLRKQLPLGRPLSAVRIVTSGDKILVRDPDAVWEAESGQIRIDFPVSEVVARAEPVLRRRAFDREPEGLEMSADDWYDAALDLEAVSSERAAAAYQHALELDAAHSDAHLNLGRLHHEAGRLEAARVHYARAAEADPASARARYNLGVVLEDLGSTREAVMAYEEALAIDDGLATAHFNLARLLEAGGREQDALRHFGAYRRLTVSGR